MKPLEVLAVDFLTTLRILRSVAAAKEIAQSTKYGWRTTDLYKWSNMRGEVGMWEAEIPNGRQLRDAIQVATRDRAMHMLTVAKEGPRPLVTWLMDQVRIRDQFLDNYYSQVAAFGQINQSTLTALDASVKLAKASRFVASVGLITGTVALALYGMGITVSGSVAAATGYGGLGTQIGVPIIGLGKSISFAVIKDWNNSGAAKTLAIAFETSKTMTNEGLGIAGDLMTAKGRFIGATAMCADEDLRIMQEAQRKAAELAERNLIEGEARLARMQRFKIGGQSTKGISEQARQLKSQRDTVDAHRKVLQQAAQDLEKTGAQQVERQALRVARAQALRRAGKRLVGGATTVFALWDMYDALSELGE